MGSKFRKIYNNLPRTVKASLWFLFCSFLQKGISIITTPLFTRLLDPEEFGQYSIFNSWLGIITVFVTLSLSNGIYTQGIIKFEDEKDVFSSSLQGMTLVMVMIWTIIYFCFYDFWNNIFSLTTTQMFMMLLIIWTTAVFSFWAAEQRVLLNYKILVIITIIVSFAKPVLGIFLVTSFSDKVTARILGLVVVEILCYSWMFFRHLNSGKRFFYWKFWKYALIFGLPLIPYYLAQNILANTDRIMIEKMVGVSEAGIYSLAYSIAQIMLLFSVALTQTMSPWIMKKIKHKETNEVSNIIYISITLVGVLNVFLIAIAPEMVVLFAPVSYYEAIWVIPPVALSVIFQFGYSLFATFEFYYEKTRFIAGITLISAVFNLILNFVFIKIFGYQAAAYTTLFSYMVQFLGHYVYVYNICNAYLGSTDILRPKIIIPIVVVFLLIGFAFLFLYNLPSVRYVSVAIALLIFGYKHQSIMLLLKSFIRLNKN